MAWYITDGVLQKADSAPAENSIPTKITGRGKVVIPDGVTEIAEDAFRACMSIKSVVLPSSVEHIGKEAFRGCSELVHIILPDGVRSIGENTFRVCLNLKIVELPDSLSCIGESAFSECRQLTRIFLSESHPHFRLENGLLISKDGTLLWADPTLERVIIPDGVTNIGNDVFAGRRSLLSVTLPDSVRRIGDRAFLFCEHLQDLSVPAELTEIGSAAFSYCKSLTDIALPDGVTRIEEAAFAYCDRLRKIRLSRGLTKIEELTFKHCDHLREVILPDCVTEIGNSAFDDCAAMTQLTLPDSLKSIGHNAFRYCLSLTHILLPDGLTSIGEGAFRSCYGLEEISLPDSVTEIGSGAFTRSVQLLASAKHWTLMDRETLKDMRVLNFPISLKDAPANMRLRLCIGFALHQERYCDELRGEYLAHIKKNAAKLLTAAFDYPELIRVMCREKLIGAKDIDAFLAEAMRREDVELTAVLLSYQAEVLTMSAVSRARQRREKSREQQDETVIDRMTARADKVGIEGLNFVVTGSLNYFDKRDDLKAFITERGGKLMSAMSAKTDYLIINDPSIDSTKSQRAAELGIVTITENEFLKLAEGKKKSSEVSGVTMI